MKVSQFSLTVGMRYDHSFSSVQFLKSISLIKSVLKNGINPFSSGYN